MAKKYSQAKKQSNPFAKKHPHSKKNRLASIAFMGVVVFVFVLWGIGYIRGFGSKDPEVKPAKKEVKAKDAHPKKVVKPISDEDFKGAKEYNFYTQLEERALILGEEERFGGVVLDNIHELPKINLESMSQSVPVLKNKNNDLIIAPLVLESNQQKTVESSKPSVKPKAQVAGNIDLQVGSFSARKDAEKHQAFLTKNGISAQILQGKNQSQQAIYRVRISRLTSQEVESVKKRLSALGVSYFEVK